MIKVFITDDHPIVREGLKQTLRETPDIAVSGEASNGEETLDDLRNQEVDVVLLDISLPGRSGLDILAQIRVAYPTVKVLILSTYPEQQYAIRALRTGAAGYLTKESAPDELITAIRKVAIGGKYVSAALAERLAFDLAGESTSRPHEKLSNREYQVMCMIASGKTVGEIAVELSLSDKTISTYRRRILDKMNLRHNAELTHYAIQQGLVT
jgi:DNA-binding NarL/FixJ family response regulator